MSLTKARKRMQAWYRYMDHVYRLSYDTLTPPGYERAWAYYVKARHQTKGHQNWTS